MKTCVWCGKYPRGIVKKRGVMTVLCCDRIEIPAASNRDEAEFIWNTGDRDWKKRMKEEKRGYD
jgi:hypothetical protein